MNPVIEIVSAKHIKHYCIELTFSDKKKVIVDFEAFLNKCSHPQHNKYKELRNFKQFKIENGNIVWGKNWDMIFPLEELYKGKIKL
ncbi:MAG: DUF2442 domain-containing protein [Bacteroidales bacterium]|jgi:hypothetical protein|nr:DUF2442 domain-containing protein [Bacteroidales bacterium]